MPRRIRRSRDSVGDLTRQMGRMSVNRVRPRRVAPPPRERTFRPRNYFNNLRPLPLGTWEQPPDVLAQLANQPDLYWDNYNEIIGGHLNYVPRSQQAGAGYMDRRRRRR